MTRFPIPTDKDLREACDSAEELNYRLVYTFKREDDMEAQWEAACDHLQDVAEAMGFDIKERKPQPPATAVDYAVRCVGAHDKCHEGGPCPYCEREVPIRDANTGRFAPATAESLYVYRGIE